MRRHRTLAPHVVLLGAGASKAAFPNGDRLGRKLPLMNNLVDVVGLGPLIERAGKAFCGEKNFEVIYSRLVSAKEHKELLKEIENMIWNYFSSLKMPEEATIYDFLLLSLRHKDAIFTFNWDPFLFDAYKRNACVAKLPEIFFLHGNVRIGICPKHSEKWGERRLECAVCLRPFDDVPLLYPVEHKDYSNHPYIRESWDAARFFLREAFVLTIFGYGAPSSDVDAVTLLKHAWMERSDRKMEHIEIVDVASRDILWERWKPFLPTGHLREICKLDDSWITMYPRRSVEALMQPVLHGEPSEQFPVKGSNILHEAQGQFLDITKWEQKSDSGRQ